MKAQDARAAVLTLLMGRAAEATVCPSEVARVLTTASDSQSVGEWRPAMPVVHAAVDGLVADGLVRLSWKRRTLPRRAGPYRIGRG